MSKYKDAVSYQCKCGRELVVPFPSMQNVRLDSMRAPSEREIKQASEALAQEVIYHQNKQCPWMANERAKAQYATKPKKQFLPKGTAFSGFGMPDDGQNYSV